MSSKKLLTVFGATGQQGGSIISTVLSSPSLSSKWALRGVTRDPSKANAQKLASQGVEMVKGDMSDGSSIGAAVEGAYAVFGMTNFWELLDKTTEVNQGKAMVDAALAAGVKHFVWSSLPYTSKLTGGELAHIEHFDGKAEVEEYIEARKRGTGMAATYFMPGVFMQGLKGFIKKGPDGNVTLTAPWRPAAAQLPLIDIVQDAGKWVMGILELGSAATDGKQVQAVSEWTTPGQAIDTLNEVAGTKVQAHQIDSKTWQSFLPEKIAQELAENMALIDQWSYYGKDAKAKQADHEKYLLSGTTVTSWKTFVKNNEPWSWE